MGDDAGNGIRRGQRAARLRADDLFRHDRVDRT